MIEELKIRKKNRNDKNEEDNETMKLMIITRPLELRGSVTLADIVA